MCQCKYSRLDLPFQIIIIIFFIIKIGQDLSGLVKIFKIIYYLNLLFTPEIWSQRR